MTRKILSMETSVQTAVPNGTNGSHGANSAAVLKPIDDKPLFSPEFICPDVQALLPEGYTIRPLRRSDYYSGYLDVLRVLTSVGEFSFEQWNERYDWMTQRNGEYFLVVICDGDQIVVGTGSLIVERKFIRSLGMVGHIEDIAIDKSQQGKKLGLRMIQALDYAAGKAGCYKVCYSFDVIY